MIGHLNKCHLEASVPKEFSILYELCSGDKLKIAYGSLRFRPGYGLIILVLNRNSDDIESEVLASQEELMSEI